VAVFSRTGRPNSPEYATAILHIAETLPELHAELDEFDADLDLLNCKNGVLHLAAVGIKDGVVFDKDPIGVSYLIAASTK
jgi:hypothetical protein